MGARSRFVLWLAYQGAWLWSAIAVLFVLGFLTHRVPDVSHILFFAAIVAAIAVTYVEMHHARAMCPRCTAAMPFDGARQAQDRAATLCWTHRQSPGYSRWRSLADVPLAAVVGVVTVFPVPLLVDAIVVLLGSR
jgi:hypothetical protein